MRPAVTVCARRGCHLCERVEELVRRAAGEAAFDLTVADIDADAALRSRYDTEVPVVAIDGADVFGHAMDYRAFVDRVRKSR